MSALKGNQENGMGGKQRTVFKRRCLQCPSRRQLAWKGSTIVLSCSKAADRKRKKGNLLEVTVRLKREINNHEDSTSKETVPICHVIFGILPNVNITKHIRDANSVKSAYSGTLRLTVSLTESRRKVVEKDLLLY